MTVDSRAAGTMNTIKGSEGAAPAARLADSALVWFVLEQMTRG
jgi:hypothetical protein